MHWDAYTVFSVLSGVILLIMAVFAGPGWGKERLGTIFGGVLFLGYGIFVATRHSGTWVFPVWIFVIPFGAAFYLIYHLIQRARKHERTPLASLAAPLGRCPRCGETLVPQQRFCNGCGLPVSTPAGQAPMATPAVTPGLHPWAAPQAQSQQPLAQPWAAPQAVPEQGATRRTWIVAGIVTAFVICLALGLGFGIPAMIGDSGREFDSADYAPEYESTPDADTGATIAADADDFEMEEGPLSVQEAVEIITTASGRVEEGSVVELSALKNLDYWEAAYGTVNGQPRAWILCQENSGDWFTAASGAGMEYFKANAIPAELRDWVQSQLNKHRVRPTTTVPPDPNASPHSITTEEIEKLIITDPDTFGGWAYVDTYQTFGEWAAAGVELYRGQYPTWVFKWVNGRWTVFSKPDPPTEKDLLAAGVPQDVADWVMTEGVPW